MRPRCLWGDAGTRPLLHLGMGRSPLRPRPALAFDVRPLHPFMAERPFKLAGDQFMFAVIVAVADRAEPGQVDPRPHDMTMLAAMALASFFCTTTARGWPVKPSSFSSRSIA